MIAYIDMPLPGTYLVNGHDILVIALALDNSGLIVVFVDQDGAMGHAQLSEININWRYNDATHTFVWVDTGEELDNANTDEPADGHDA